MNQGPADEKQNAEWLSENGVDSDGGETNVGCVDEGGYLHSLYHQGFNKFKCLF